MVNLNLVFDIRRFLLVFGSIHQCSLIFVVGFVNVYLCLIIFKNAFGFC